MPWQPFTKGRSLRLEEYTSNEATRNWLRQVGAVDNGFVWVRDEKDPATGAQRVVVAVGPDNWVDANAAPAIPGTEQQPGNTAEQLGAFTSWLDTEIGRGTFTADQAIDLRRSLADKIAGKDERKQAAQNLASNMLALAPKVSPENSESHAKLVTAMMLASGIFGDFSKPRGPAVTGFAAGLGESAIVPPTIPTVAPPTASPTTTSRGGYGGSGYVAPPTSPDAVSASAQQQPGASMGPPTGVTSESAQTQPGTQWGPPSGGPLEKSALKDVSVAAQGLGPIPPIVVEQLRAAGLPIPASLEESEEE